MADNDKIMKANSDDQNQIESNLSEIDNLKQMYLEKTNNAFSKVVSRVFPGAVDKAMKKITKEAIELKWQESKELREIKQEYQKGLLLEICNVRLADAKLLGRKYISEKLENVAIETAREVVLKKNETTEIINKECERIKTARAEKSLENTIDVLYYVFDESMNKMKNIVDEEIKKAIAK